jgi:hypothetical protein
MRSHLLHIRSAPAESRAARATEESLAAISVPMDVCGDVYRGLARLVRGQEDPPAVVFVCVDDLGPAELEFFGLVGRAVPGIRVYVYGAERAERRMADAVARGATGAVTQEVLDRLRLDAGRSAKRDTTAVASDVRSRITTAQAAAPGSAGVARPDLESADDLSDDAVHAEPDRENDTETARDTDEPPKPAAARDLQEIPHTPVREAHDGPRRDVFGSGEPAETEDAVESDDTGAPDRWREEAPRPVTSDAPDVGSAPNDQGGPRTGRVPWLHYEDRPVRKGPPRPTPQDRMRPTEASPPSRGPVKPLLSEEELRALIGDDVAAIEPDDDKASEQRDRPEEGELG